MSTIKILWSAAWRLFVFYFAIAALLFGTAMAQSQDAVARTAYIDNVSTGMEIGLRMSGCKLTLEQRTQIRRAVEETADQVIPRLKQLGLYEAWKGQLLHPDMVALNSRTHECRSIAEMEKLANAQIEWLNRNYPGLLQRLEQDQEFNRIMRRLFKNINKITKGH